MDWQKKIGLYARHAIVAAVMCCAAFVAPPRAAAADEGAVSPMPLKAADAVAGPMEVFTGRFKEPELPAVPTRTIEIAPVVKEQTKDVGMTRVWNDTLLTVAGGAAVIMTIMIGLVLKACIVRNAQGRRRVCWSVEAKVATSLGLVVGAVCGAGVLCTHASLQAQAAARRANVAISAGGQVATVPGMLEAMRAMTEAYMLTGDERELERYAATRAEALRLASMADAEELKPLVTSVRVHHGAFKKVVENVDRDRAVVSSQVAPAHERAEEILGHVRLSVGEGGDTSASGRLDLAMSFTGAMRSALERGVHDATDVDALAFAARRAREEIAGAKGLVEGEQRRLALEEADQALDFAVRQVGTLSIVREDGKDAIRDLRMASGVMVSKGELVREFLGAWADRSMREADALASRERYFALGAAGAGVLVAMLVGYAMMRSISRRMRRVVDALQGLAANDLMRPPVNSTAGDEIGELSRATDRVAAGLRDVMTEVSISLQGVARASEDRTGGQPLDPETAEQISARTGHLIEMVGRYKLGAGAGGSQQDKAA